LLPKHRWAFINDNAAFHYPRFNFSA